ncbi:hypothetical protein Pelo_8172 [Pelomyxa schiedti]|nr:hypothetical protein Pelo_8172 [Pelomyxa schiedti]
MNQFTWLRRDAESNRWHLSAGPVGGPPATPGTTPTTSTWIGTAPVTGDGREGNETTSTSTPIATPALPPATVPPGYGTAAAIPAALTTTLPRTLGLADVPAKDRPLISAVEACLSSGSDVSVEGVIGCGFWGPVLRISTRDGPFAVKVFGPDRAEYADDCVAQLNSLKGSRVPHLLTIFEAVALAENKFAVVTDIAAHGNLHQKMLEPSFRALERVKALVGIAEAALAVHTILLSPHGNIKPTNVLFSASETVLLADHYIGKLESTRSRTYRSATPRHYGDPESINNGVTYKSDVYAIGILATELLTGRRAPNIPTQHSIKKAMLSLSQTDRTALLDKQCHWPDVACRELMQLICRCCAFRPDKRPEMGKLRKALLEIQETLVVGQHEPAKSLKGGCPICMENPPEFAAIPCGHTFCATCTKNSQSSYTKQCGFCRQAVTTYQRVYLLS